MKKDTFGSVVFWSVIGTVYAITIAVLIGAVYVGIRSWGRGGGYLILIVCIAVPVSILWSKIDSTGRGCR